ncbi:MAG TPA: tetratricopeptide repeat protein [Anaeromyxobacter sp.]|nr:tetratricopeptide repeat protein [Anaeromyxobacter sp.]
MAVDKNKIIAEATKLVQKGAIDKAIATYQKILAEDAKDVRVLLKVGELFQKKGDERLAADAFTKVAETYAEQGFFLKAVAVYKQIVKLAPDDVRVNERLAGLYQQLGLMSDAMSQLQFMASAYEKAGDAGKLTEVLQKMVDLDPDNIASSIKLGELHARAGRTEPALECLQRAAAYLKKHSRTDEYLKVAERIAALQGDDLALTKELANIYLAKGDTKRALAKLQLCFKGDPKDVDTLHLLAQAFRDLGQTSKTLSVYKELAHVHEEQGRHGDARATWRKVQELAPDDPDAAAAIGASAAATPLHQVRVATPPPSPPAAVLRPPPPPPAPVRPTGPVAAPVGTDAVQKLLTETDVYVKYGLHDKALEHLKKVLAVDPKSPDAHERAREIHLAAGRPSEAGDAGAAAVRAWLARGQQDRAREALLRLRHIDPGHPQLPELAAESGGTEELEVVEEVVPADVVLDPAAARPARVEEDELAIRAAGEASEELVEDDEPTASEEAGSARRRREGEARAIEDEGVALEVGEPEPEAAPAGDALAEEAAAASAGSEEIDDEPVGPVILAPPPPPAPKPAPKPAAAPPPGPAAKKPAIAPPPPPPAEDEGEADLSDELEEASFFVQQGLLDDARQALQNLLEFYPGHSGVLARLAELDRRAGPADRAAGGPQKAAPRASSGGDDSFDIARELAEELGPAPAGGASDDEFQYSVEDVFNQFKKGVEATVQKEDSATHYDLGIAYKEMGLLDDAIHEFETALGGNDRRREVDCLTMIGLCHLTREAPKDAIQAFRRALGSEFLTKDAAKAIHFELGTAYEAAGQPEVALFYLQKVARADPAYREVGGRVSALGGGPGKPPPEGEARTAAAAAAPRPANGVARPAPARPPAAASAAPPAPAMGAKKNIGYL